MKTATGLTEFAEVKLLERPHMTKNYLMKEMMFSVGRKHSRRLRQIAIIIGGILPVALIGLSAGVYWICTVSGRAGLWSAFARTSGGKMAILCRS